MSETALVKRIQIELAKSGARLFRNNVGVLKDLRKKYVTYGLCPGSSDLIGWTRTGRFLAIEVKAPGARTAPDRLLLQVAFIEAVVKDGGIAFFASSLEEAQSKLEHWNYAG